MAKRKVSGVRECTVPQTLFLPPVPSVEEAEMTGTEGTGGRFDVYQIETGVYAGPRSLGGVLPRLLDCCLGPPRGDLLDPHGHLPTCTLVRLGGAFAPRKENAACASRERPRGCANGDLRPWSTPTGPFMYQYFYVSVLFVGRLGAFEDLFDGLPFLSTADSVGLALCVVRELR